MFIDCSNHHKKTYISPATEDAWQMSGSSVLYSGSCQGRCGNLDWDDNFYLANNPCYCDVDCKVYRNCCSDVEEECPAIAGESLMFIGVFPK